MKGLEIHEGKKNCVIHKNLFHIMFIWEKIRHTFSVDTLKILSTELVCIEKTNPTMWVQ